MKDEIEMQDVIEIFALQDVEASTSSKLHVTKVLSHAVTTFTCPTRSIFVVVQLNMKFLVLLLAAGALEGIAAKGVKCKGLKGAKGEKCEKADDKDSCKGCCPYNARCIAPDSPCCEDHENCFTKEVWSKAKVEWCCTIKGLGC